MTVTIRQERPSHLSDYARVPIGFAVGEVFDNAGVAALRRGETATSIPVATPYWKDYDAYAGNHPTDWPDRFDVMHWTILGAYLDSERVGGAVLIHDGAQIDLLRDRAGCALLWDLRVAPENRTQGIGTALLRAAEAAAFCRGAAALTVETQQINVPACRFYARNGFALDRVVPGAYPDFPNEAQLLWQKVVTPAAIESCGRVGARFDTRLQGDDQ